MTMWLLYWSRHSRSMRSLFKNSIKSHRRRTSLIKVNEWRSISSCIRVGRICRPFKKVQRIKSLNYQCYLPTKELTTARIRCSSDSGMKEKQRRNEKNHDINVADSLNLFISSLQFVNPFYSFQIMCCWKNKLISFQIRHIYEFFYFLLCSPTLSL